MTRSQHVYEVRPRKDHRGVDLEKPYVKKRDYWALGLAVPTVCFLFGTVVMIQDHDYATAITLRTRYRSLRANDNQQVSRRRLVTALRNTPASLAEIVSDDFPVFHRDGSCLFCAPHGNDFLTSRRRFWLKMDCRWIPEGLRS